MRAFLRSHRVLVASILASTAIAFVACSDSNNVAGPDPVDVADVSGDWSGQYVSNAPSLCTGNTDAMASLTQTGSEVRGIFRAQGCGVSGSFRGRVTGTLLQGSVDMIGCTGGAVSASLEGGALMVTIGDFHKDLVTGDAEVFPGGQVRLQR